MMMMMMMNLHENITIKLKLRDSTATENSLLWRFLYSMTSLARGWWKLVERYRGSEMKVWTSAGKNFIYISKTARLRSNHALLSPPPPSDVTARLREVWVEDSGRSSLVYPHGWVIGRIPRSTTHDFYISITNKPTKLHGIFSAGLKWSNRSQNILEGVCCKHE